MDLNEDRLCLCLVHQGIPEEVLDDEELRTVGHVFDHGCSVMQVVGCPRGGYDWSYTIGMWHSYGGPDVAMFGLGSPDMGVWLNEIRAMVADGLNLQPDMMLDDVLDGFPLLLKPVHPDWFTGLFNWGSWFYDSESFPMLQAIWPDKHGVWPWQPGVRERCQLSQPRLWIPPGEQPPNMWTVKCHEALSLRN